MNFDERFIETLKNIKEHCDKIKSSYHCCGDCKFSVNGEYCQINKIVDILYDASPWNWNIEEIERIVKQ